MATHELRFNGENTLASLQVCDLPYEILVEIFMDVLWSLNPLDSLAMIPIAQVSQCWRNASIYCSSLWSCLILDRNSLRDKSGLPVVLPRSKGAPLYLHLMGGHIVSEATLALISLNLHRIKELSFNGPHAPIHKILGALNTHPMPLLQKLDLFTLGGGINFDPNHLVLNGFAPNLRSLAIGPTNTNWSWPVFRQLTNLLILRADLDPMLSGLKTMSQLQSLEVRRVVRSDINQPEDMIVHMPFLRNLGIVNDSDTFPGSLKLLHHLHTSPEGRIKLHLWLISPQANNAPHHPLLRLQTPSRRLEIRCSKLCAEFTVPEGKPLVQVKVTWHSLNIPAGDCFSNIIRWLGQDDSGFQNGDLKLSNTFRNLRSINWIEMARSLCHLETLQVDHGICAKDFMRAMARSTEALMPELKHLIITDDGLEEEPRVKSRFDGIVELLAFRCESGREIAEVTVIVKHPAHQLWDFELQQLSGLGVQVVYG